VLTCGNIVRETLGWGLDEDDDERILDGRCQGKHWTRKVRNSSRNLRIFSSGIRQLESFGLLQQIWKRITVPKTHFGSFWRSSRGLSTKRGLMDDVGEGEVASRRN